MSGTVFAVVLLAAALHATWNALVKGGADKTASMTAVVLGQGAAGLLLLPIAPPLDWACWPYLLAGIALHLGYQLFLIQSYKLGDLTQVYPIARGASPLLVAAGTAMFLGAAFSQAELLALLMISAGILSIALVRRQDGTFSMKAGALALVTGMFIASYSIVDGQGARVAGTALGFFGTLTAANALAFGAIIGVSRPEMLRGLPALWRLAVFGGGASFTAYVLVVWAFTQAPIALVTALRETSIIFALLLGVGFLGEKLDLRKVFSTALTLAGAVLLRLNRS
ncbi:DMT family transporter [Leisingera aquaemixtae]|uniref:DMT family transporter n=1 Tax=Leisingera aquaemixtae TaxID=1396826 RepID=UPI001C96D3E1|nr:DMT family transporter [Leisingera aquaemixtae]MBY6067400.1 DMT family transporter [Leisingera aquaemixtae]